MLASTLDYHDNARTVAYGIGFLTLLYYLLNSIWHCYFGLKAPLAGRHHFWEPALVLGLRFSRNSAAVLRDGYRRYGKSIFKVRRNDCDLVIISRRYVDELRDLKENKLSAVDAGIRNLVGKYTLGDLHMIRTSDLHRRVLVEKLTPAVGNLYPAVKSELEFGLKTDMPSCDDWTPLHIHSLTIKTIARVFARIFIGPDLCRNPEWLHISVSYTRNVSIARNLLRLFPAALQHLAARCMPSYWRIYSQRAAAERLLGPIIRERRVAATSNDVHYKGAEDLLQWMMDEAREDEKSEADMAHRQLLLGLASIHTTSLRILHTFYDLCAYPECVDPLREEKGAVLREDGSIKKTTLHRLRRLDSFLKESQRLHPMLALTFQRIVRKDITLKDGVRLPAGTHIAVPAEAIGFDPEALPGGGDPNVFDPFRYSRLREDPSKTENINRYQFAMTSSDDLHFGHGRFACPGRFFASSEIKLILVYMLLRYDFKFANGRTRPGTFCYAETMVPDTTVKIIVRKREMEEDLVEILEN
ncbi:cytochrome P450 [Teratosphaeria nubilosa]|uniref:Cytochrome P450 n=1 Tax=Teratosphaeria nubilosa TaxID=161662 RepID=A0A6G1KTW1_9PEZI|nr:cytochrome P450 [Teratosphaeria nubilosa]